MVMHIDPKDSDRTSLVTWFPAQLRCGCQASCLRGCDGVLGTFLLLAQ